MTNCNWYVIFMVAVALAMADFAIGSSPVRRGNNSHEDKEKQTRRHLLDEEEECVLYLKDMQFEDHTTHKEVWACEFTREQAQRFGGIDIMDIEGVPEEVFESMNVISGQAVMKTRGAFVEQFIATHHFAMVVPTAASVEIKNLPDTDPRHHRQRRQRRRNLATSKSGTLETLVLRVVDVNQKAPASTKELIDDIFTDRVSLKTQYAACSHNQLNIQPAGVGNGGVVDIPIELNAKKSDSSSLEIAAKVKAESMYGGSGGLASKYDLVLFCQPPGSGPWVAYAYINRWDSFYNAHWCQRVSAQMHEVGHNLGLAHSGKGANEYGDMSSIMGYSYNDDDGPIMCFNAAKNYQLGWYDLQKQSINPLVVAATSPKTYTMTGIDDYVPNGSNKSKLITLRLESNGDYGGTDFYIGFNGKMGPNSGTLHAADRIVIFKKKGGPDIFGPSYRVADLDVGQSFVIEKYKDSIYDVEIKFKYLSGNKRDAQVTISTSGGYPTQAPTTSCGNAGSGRLRLELRTDIYGVETSWAVREQGSGAVVAESDQQYEGNRIYLYPDDSGSVCLQAGECYKFEIQDSFGDGMCCNQGEGYYKLFLDGSQILSGGQFGKTESRSFCVSSGNAPTQAPTKAPTQAPTKAGCEDDPDFRYNDDSRKTCKRWVGRGMNNLTGRNIKRIKRRCRKFQDGKRVWSYCPKICALVGLGPCSR